MHRLILIAALWLAAATGTDKAPSKQATDRQALVQGSWVFGEVADAATLDPTTLKEAQIVFRSWAMTLAPGGRYIFGGTAVGTWALNPEQSKVQVTARGQTVEWAIQALDQKSMTLYMGKAAIVFVRPPPPTAPPVAKAEAKDATQPAAAAAEQDKNSKELLRLYTVRDPVHRPLIKQLYAYLKLSMAMDRGGNFDRMSWRRLSSQISRTAKDASADILAYRTLLKAASLKTKDNELHDLLVVYLGEAATFVKTCEVWAELISAVDADNDSLLEQLKILEKNSRAMVATDNAVLELLPKYRKRNGLQ